MTHNIYLIIIKVPFLNTLTDLLILVPRAARSVSVQQFRFVMTFSAMSVESMSNTAPGRVLSVGCSTFPVRLQLHPQAPCQRLVASLGHTYFSHAFPNLFNSPGTAKTIIRRVDLGLPVPLGASGDEKPPSITVTGDPVINCIGTSFCCWVNRLLF